jgi:hypothetical protein
MRRQLTLNKFPVQRGRHDDIFRRRVYAGRNRQGDGFLALCLQCRLTVRAQIVKAMIAGAAEKSSQKSAISGRRRAEKCDQMS